MSSYASNLLGEHNPNIVCMDQSGCKLLFPQSELERFLAPKLLELYHRVRQRKDIEAAGLENLEECPFCDYKCVIENEMEKLFRCENVDCGAVSCRECKKPVCYSNFSEGSFFSDRFSLGSFTEELQG
jgi:TRIAD3 protein (E3 ubiquitin-protein ligase RNF216)